MDFKGNMLNTTEEEINFEIDLNILKLLISNKIAENYRKNGARINNQLFQSQHR
jgi:hypothetical protein